MNIVGSGLKNMDGLRWTKLYNYFYKKKGAELVTSQLDKELTITTYGVSIDEKYIPTYGQFPSFSSTQYAETYLFQNYGNKLYLYQNTRW